MIEDDEDSRDDNDEVMTMKTKPTDDEAVARLLALEPDKTRSRDRSAIADIERAVAARGTADAGT